MDQASRCEILALQQKLVQYLKELTAIQPEKVSDRLSFMDFEEGERSLGRLVLEPNIELKAAAEESPRSGSMCLKEKWALKIDLEKFGPKQREFKMLYDVAAFNNKIIVADIEHKLLITFSPESKHQSTIIPQSLQIKGLTNPSHVAVNKKDDQLIVLDSPAVKIFNKKYQLLHQFTPGRGSDSEPSCLAVDDNNLIAVGYINKYEISLHNPDGSFIRTLPAPGIDYHFTICKQRLIYTDYLSKKLVSVDYNGDITCIFAVDITSDICRMSALVYCPTGVCCDRDGSIYVAVRGLLFTHISGEIWRFSPDGKYIECVIKDCSPPRGITFTPGGDLVVAAYESVQIYHRV